jgi:hypothetical protein
VRFYLSYFGQAQKQYRTEHGKYATMEELAGHIGPMNDFSSRTGYKFELTVSSSGYRLTATPTEYGKTGRLSFYTDQSGIVRAGDHGGSPATASDKPVGSDNKEN